ncbi:MAG: T9SS type A sorting domain-containing protein [Flavobacterium sp.]|nr:T9SS type A sorting domain-containing protein [Flavobacterium sp.]
MMKHYLKLLIIFLSIFFLSVTANAQNDCSTTGFKVDYKTTPSGTYAAKSTRTICQLPEFYENAPAIATNIYGSRTDKQTTATGYFYSKMIDGRWWVVDPDGYLNICRAVNAISKGTGTTSTNAFATKFGNSTTTWMTTTKEFLKGIGFNVAGAWSTTSTITSNPTQASNPLAYTIILNWMSGYGAGRTVQLAGHMGYPNDCIFVFEQGFVNYCETKAQALAANKYDKNLFGYFTDNELPFKNANLTGYLNLGVTEPTNENYLAAKQWLTDNGYTTADATNTEVQKKFLGYVGKTYFSIVYNAIKKYDPNHMSLGPRVDKEEARANSYFMQAVGPYVDILAINYYREWTPNSAFMTAWGTNLNKPFMVTEFYTKGEDSGLANTSGAGWVVKTQLDRGYEYQNYTLALLESKYCVGWHWFKYFDNDPSMPGDPSNIDGNKGIFKIDYEPYTDLVEKMKELNLKTYNLIDYFDYKSQFPPLIIYPEADAYYKDQVNYGFDDRLGIKNSPYGNMREAFLRFDLTGQSTNVGDVNLYLSVLRAGDPGKVYKADFLTDDSWTEGGITMANHPTNDAEIGRWADGLDVKLNVKTPFVETVNSDKKLSIKLSAVSEIVSQLEYASRENTTVSLRPRIEISQNAPDGPADLDNLSELIVQDKRVAAFQPDILSYNIALPISTTTNPSILFVKPNASMQVVVTGPVNVLSSLDADRIATVKTTSADGTKTKTYTLQFKLGENLSVPNLLKANDFTLYPNPVRSNGIVNIDIPNTNYENNQITIYDTNGKMVFYKSVKEIKLQLTINASLQPGMYFISVNNSNGRSTKKLIVK